jgi:hypothetical protein
VQKYEPLIPIFKQVGHCKLAKALQPGVSQEPCICDIILKIFNEIKFINQLLKVILQIVFTSREI